ncbi:MAG: SSU ribosomal protein S4p (S9e) @ SSU ribosomal protein S4p (S9e), zinc-dependent [uncultured Chloroflexia bacterium]|uniref:Small ribosomal subunit protein uS4 n=1 Tax=uncultured Chloroflexia bacterium TaxID=1672391 RepID=A0A6J4JHP0_9CHLR|nr:MAG: SSU ribosomal protein S4p (S9e) @ SSU ribosomal protein S4p (S9e), zinc-dependent [uncultured Chloroflexia bacterium]
MARIRTPVCRLCRREGVKLMLKGERCLTPKCPIERRNYPPGQHGQGFRRRQMSDYGGQLREKQKLRRIFFVMEKQFRRHFDSAQRMKGITGTNLLQVLERRLDNVVFRLGFADSRRQARQLVNHGHFVVNGRKTNIPSFIVKVGDEISVRPQSRTRTYFTDLDASGILRKKAVPEWLSLDAGAMAGRVLRVPERSEMDLAVNEQLVVELYSR